MDNTITIHGPRLLDVTVEFDGAVYRGTFLTQNCLSFEDHLPGEVMNYVMAWFDSRSKQPIDYSLAAD